MQPVANVDERMATVVAIRSALPSYHAEGWKLRDHWEPFVFGTYDTPTVQKAVFWDDWQLCRLSMKSMPLGWRHAALSSFMMNNMYDDRMPIVLTNYVHALARGGMLK